MPIYFFRSPYELAAPNSEDEIEFDDLAQAIEQARAVICELAANFLNISPGNMIAIEIHDVDGITQAEVRLSLEVFRRSSTQDDTS